MTGRWWRPSESCKYTVDINHQPHYPHHRGPPHNYLQKHQNSETGERRRAGLSSQLSTHRDPRSANPPVHGQMMEGADKQGAGEQGRPVRQNVYQDYRPQFHRGPPQRRQPKEDSKEEDKKNQGYEIQGQHPSQHRYYHNFNYPHRDTQKTLSHTMAKRQKQLIHQLRIHLLPRLNRAGLSKCWLTSCTVSILLSGLLIQQEEMNMNKVPAIRNAQKVGAEDLKCLLFAH